MTPSKLVGRLTHSSSSPGTFFPGDGQSQAVVNSHLGSSFGNTPNPICTSGRPILGPVSLDQNYAVLNSVTNSGPSVDASSLVTDANSALFGGPYLQRNVSFNTESNMKLPASPLSFSSYNISVSGSSVLDVSSVIQQGNHQEVTAQHALQDKQLQQEGVSGASSLPRLQSGKLALPNGQKAPRSFTSDPDNISRAHKKQRTDPKQDDIMQHILRRQDSIQLQGDNPQLQSLLQQQRLRQQQQILQSLPQMQETQLLQQQQLLQSRPPVQAAMLPVTAIRGPVGGVCARRLMQYLYHLRQRPPHNSIAYWKRFVAEYYSPLAKKRWCLSLYDNNVGHHALGVFPLADVGAWRCDICGSKSGKGFESTFDVLPRLYEVKFGSGVIDEILFLGSHREYGFRSGIVMLEYKRAVQESVYEQLHVVHEGQLRIIFSQDLKILSWEFCARRHEELFIRRLVAPKVNQFLQAAEKCESTIAESGSDGISQQELQTNSNMVLAAGCQLAKSMELQSVNDYFGFSEGYLMCLQIADVVNSMKDLIDYCQAFKAGPIDGLKNYTRHNSASKQIQIQKMREMEQLANVQGQPPDRITLDRLMALHPGANNNTSNNHHMVGGVASRDSEQAAKPLMRQNSMTLQPEASPCNRTNQIPTSKFQGSTAFVSGSTQSLRGSGYSSPHLTSQPSQHSLGQQMIQQMPHMSSNVGAGVQQQSIVGQSTMINGTGFGNNSSATTTAATPSIPGAVANASSRSNGFKDCSESDSCVAGVDNAFNQPASDLPKILCLPDDIARDMSHHDFTENGFFDSDLGDIMGYDWEL